MTATPRSSAKDFLDGCISVGRRIWAALGALVVILGAGIVQILPPAYRWAQDHRGLIDTSLVVSLLLCLGGLTYFTNARQRDQRTIEDIRREADRLQHSNDPARRAADKALVARILGAMPVTAAEFLRTWDFGANWREGQTRPALRLDDALQGVEIRFHDPELEDLRGSLRDANARFTYVLVMETWGLNTNITIRTVMEHANRDRSDGMRQLYEERRSHLNTTAVEVAIAYDALIEKAHRQLLLEPVPLIPELCEE